MPPIENPVVFLNGVVASGRYRRIFADVIVYIFAH